jgi:hypothetical protein
MAARHRSFIVEKSSAEVDHERLAVAIPPAITTCAEAFLNPPIANLGNQGILTAAKRMRTWFDRVDDPRQDLPVIALLMERAGTGGALFRNLYRDFLTECCQLLEGTAAAEVLTEGRDLFAESATLWTSVAGLVEAAGTTGDTKYLVAASQQVEDIAAIETRAMEALRLLSEVSA